MAVDYFLKLDAVEGESEAAGMETQIHLLSWNWSGHNSGSGGRTGGSGAGKVEMSDVSFAFMMDKAYGTLAQKMANGEHIKEGLITCRRAGGAQEIMYELHMKQIFITSLNISGSAGDEIPVVNGTLNYKAIKQVGKPQSGEGAAGGDIEMMWDLAKEAPEF